MIEKLKIILEMIKIEHTIFAMPFLYAGAILASKGLPSLHVLIWITIGLFSARSAAMLLNRLIDRDIDAKNPRTKERALPRGVIGEREVIFVIILCLIILLICALKLNMLCVKLYPLAVTLFVIYPYLKRFTWLSHIALGSTLAIAPIGSWVAVKASLDLGIILLGLAVVFWVAGFDVIYACQDIEFDRSFGLCSIPAKFGLRKAFFFSAVFHLLTVVFLFATYFVMHLGKGFLFGVIVISLLLAYEHLIVKPGNLKKVNVAFFKVNALVSLCFLLATILEVIV